MTPLKRRAGYRDQHFTDQSLLREQLQLVRVNGQTEGPRPGCVTHKWRNKFSVVPAQAGADPPRR
ncbi:hypothetical protein ACE10Z_17910 [Bradyrhizobium sp. Pha-3]|uniref:hypothetical protein n=1 Tax=Bradyrhizobium sp. Pha-3 TaxID=208375 RepID=UPI0035D52399